VSLAVVSLLFSALLMTRWRSCEDCALRILQNWNEIKDNKDDNLEIVELLKKAGAGMRREATHYFGYDKDRLELERG